MHCDKNVCYQCRFEAAFIPPLGTATLLTLSPSDCGAMRLPAHQMALIASDCVGTGPAPARKPCRLGLEMEATDRYVHVSQTLELRANDISGDVQTMFRAANRRSAAAPLAPPPGAAVSGGGINDPCIAHLACASPNLQRSMKKQEKEISRDLPLQLFLHLLLLLLL